MVSRTNSYSLRDIYFPEPIRIIHCVKYIFKTEITSLTNNKGAKEKLHYKQARKLQATLEGCNSKLSLTHSLADGGKV